MLKLRGIEVKKITWTKTKISDEGVVLQLSKLTLSLEISEPDIEAVTPLLAFASEGPSTWTLGDVQRELSKT